jgi:hypothetical protein
MSLPRLLRRHGARAIEARPVAVRGGEESRLGAASNRAGMFVDADVGAPDVVGRWFLHGRNRGRGSSVVR